MDGIQEWTIPAENVKSLCWSRDDLIDLVGNGTHYRLDGSILRTNGGYGYRFDAVLASPSGSFAAIYEKRGTKGLILKNDLIIREINRSFSHAEAYEYPITLFALPDGREVIAHCPEEYERLEIDDLETGERLTKAENREPTDYFFSRLSANSAGTRLLTNGWVWQPWDVAMIFDVSQALADPRSLDGYGSTPNFQAEVSSAAFLGNDTLILSASSDEYDEEKDPNELHDASLATFDLKANKILSQVKYEEFPGTIMPVGANWVVGFYEHPRLFDLKTGKVLYRWPELNSGNQASSIIRGIDPVPPIALDPQHFRFAVADKSAIHVVQIDPVAFQPTV